MIKFDKSLSFDDIVLVPRYSDLKSRNEANPSSCGYSLPLITSPMDTVTTPEMIKFFVDENLLAMVHRYFKSAEEQLDYVLKIGDVSEEVVRREVCLHRAVHPMEVKRYCDNIYFCVGSVSKYKDWIDFLFRAGIRKFCIDMAMGNSELCCDTIVYLKSLRYPVYNPDNGEIIHERSPKVIAGNIVSKDGMDRLIKAGADGIRCGIGSGSICTTRTATGFGVPQLSALVSCASRKYNNVMLIADGGIRNGGDIAKSLRVGADMVMVGKLLAETDLAGGQCYDKDRYPVYVNKDGWDKVIYRSYRGMASNEARTGVLSNSSIEGVAGLVKYTGKTSDLIHNLKLNLQASLSYAGVRNWEEFRRVVKILEITANSSIESQTHIL